MFEHLQILFDRLVGIHQAESVLRERARQTFSQTLPLPASLDTPACWRRRPRVVGASRLRPYHRGREPIAAA